MREHVLGAPSRSGPEADLVRSFVDNALPRVYGEEHRVVFIEPQLETARPDIVLVAWDPATAANWPKARRFLRRVDLRLAQFLLTNGSSSETKLKVHFPRQLRASLERLERAGLAAQINNRWALEPLGDVFAVRRIVSFEAKISALSKALRQAHFNTWFSSESYILTSVRRPRTKVIDQARTRGIGLWSFCQDTVTRPLLSAQERSLPQSFASWLFNEWAWRSV